jgi:hypothetical protein
VEDLVQLLFFAALILFGLLGSARKKKKGQQVQARRPPVRRPPVERRVPSGESGRAEASGPAPPPRKRSIAQELFDLLQERIEEPPAGPQAPRRAREPVVVEQEPQSLETLEPAGGKSHERFHELYVSEAETIKPYEQQTAKPYKQETAKPYKHEAAKEPDEDAEDRKARLELSRRKLQQAFIMKEVLGPPKGLD